jgi:hypothetical protein
LPPQEIEPLQLLQDLPPPRPRAIGTGPICPTSLVQLGLHLGQLALELWRSASSSSNIEGRLRLARRSDRLPIVVSLASPPRRLAPGALAPLRLAALPPLCLSPRRVLRLAGHDRSTLGGGHGVGSCAASSAVVSVRGRAPR